METFSALLAPCVGIHRSPVSSPHKGQWRGALMFFIFAWINGWINNREPGDLRRHRAYYEVIVMCPWKFPGTVFTVKLDTVLSYVLQSFMISNTLTLIPPMKSNFIHYKVWDEINHPFLNFNGATAEVWEWIINFIPHVMIGVITHPYWDYS